MSKQSAYSRRKLLINASATGAGVMLPMIVPRHCVAGSGMLAPSETVNVAGIGVGGMGGNDIRASHYSGARIAALCDVDKGKKRAPERHGAAANNILVKPIGVSDFPDAPRYRDFRELLDKEKNIDAVIVGTPDHTHAPIAMAASKAGKHVYCEKPLARTVYEIRKLTETAREQGVATQLGNQGHSFLACREFCEAIWSGAIGDVSDVHVMMRFSQGAPKWRLSQLEKKHEIPKSLDWDLWLGPAPTRGYSPMYHPSGWRGWRQFGSGMLGDFLCHLVDPVFWALRLDAPTSIVAEAEGYDPVQHREVFPKSAKIRYDFPARGGREPVTIHWYDGELYSPPSSEELTGGEYELPVPGYRGAPGLGVLVVGEKGHIVYESHGARNWRIYPEERMKEYMGDRPRLDRPGVRSTGLLNYNHHRDWLHACKGWEPAGSNFDYGGPLTELAALGNIATLQRGTELQWDAERMNFPNHPEANQLLHDPYRDGWVL
ncbi:MAG: Gfo/Idh/MocA family oxidoreductase [Planctomycetota bacterium]